MDTHTVHVALHSADDTAEVITANHQPSNTQLLPAQQHEQRFTESRRAPRHSGCAREPVIAGASNFFSLSSPLSLSSSSSLTSPAVVDSDVEVKGDEDDKEDEPSPALWKYFTKLRVGKNGIKCELRNKELTATDSGTTTHLGRHLKNGDKQHQKAAALLPPSQRKSTKAKAKVRAPNYFPSSHYCRRLRLFRLLFSVVQFLLTSRTTSPSYCSAPSPRPICRSTRCRRASHFAS